MAWPWGPVLAGIFLVELETSVIPTFGRSLLKRRRYVDDTVCYVKVNTANDILNKSNGFHQNINLHKNWKIIISYHFWKFYWFVIIIMSRLLLIKSQLTVTYIWIGNRFHSVCRNVVLWRACLICSTPKYLQEELDHFSYVFQKLPQLSY